MNDSKKNLTEEELKLIKEEELFLQEVYSDPEVANSELPADLQDKVFSEIRAREDAKKIAQKQEERLAEERELIEYGRRYKRAVKMQKWVVLAAILIMAMAFGMVSVGGPEKIFERIKYAWSDRKQTNVDTYHEDISPTLGMREEEAYQEIEDVFEFTPVGLGYIPENVVFLESQIGEEIQLINMVYGADEKTKIVYLIQPNFRGSSLGKDMEDEFVEEYEKDNGKTTIYIRKYKVDEGEERWSVQFEYQNVSYSMTIMDSSRNEVEKIADNLYFPKK